MSADDYPDREGEEELRQKIAAGSQDPDDYRNLIDLLLLSSSGRYGEAIELYRQALALPLTGFKKAQLSMELAWIYYEIGRRQQAILLARDALELLSSEPKDAEVLYCLGSSQAVLSLSEFFEDPVLGTETARLALESLKKAIAHHTEFKDKPHAYIDAAGLYCLLGNFEEA